jgi:hypothetical protein
MADPRKVFSSVDAAPQVLFAKRDEDSQIAHPVLADSAGRLIISSLVPKEYDSIELSPANQPTTILYKLAGLTVATLTLTYSGSDISSVVRT